MNNDKSETITADIRITNHRIMFQIDGAFKTAELPYWY